MGSSCLAMQADPGPMLGSEWAGPRCGGTGGGAMEDAGVDMEDQTEAGMDEFIMEMDDLSEPGMEKDDPF